MYKVFELPEDFLTRDYTPEEIEKFDAQIFGAIGTQLKLNEDLTNVQKKQVDQWSGWQNQSVKREHDRVFGEGNDRITIPYDTSDEPKITSSNYHNTPAMRNIAHSSIHHRHVINELKKAGYDVDDYASGLAFHESTPEKKIKIRKAMESAGIDSNMTHFYSKPKYETTDTGKIVKDANGEKVVKVPPKQMTLGQVYDADPIRASIKTPKHIVITRNKYDVAGMSTDRPWSSCMNMVDGCNRRYLKSDIAHQTLTAYITDSSDSEIKKPIGRINLKEFNNGSHSIFRPEKSQYGMIPHNFAKKVSEWAENNYESKPGVYIKNQSLYNDDGETVKLEKMHEISGGDCLSAAYETSKRILNSGDDYNHKDDDGYERDDAIKDAALHHVDKILSGTDDKTYAKNVIHLIADHATDHDGEKQSTHGTDFAQNSRYDLGGYDVMHHWAIGQREENRASVRIEDGIKQFSPEELAEHIQKCHDAIHTSYGAGDHEALKDVHAMLLHHAFSKKIPAADHRILPKTVPSFEHPHVASMVMHHLTSDAHMDYYDSSRGLFGEGSTIFDTHHPAELVKDPRLMHHLLTNDITHLPHHDIFDSNHPDRLFEHIGKHADAKLADHVMFHEGSHRTDKDSFVANGLNENPDGENIQHKLTEHMLLGGGEYVEPSYHHKREHPYLNNPESRTHWDEDHVDVFASIANHTKFPSVFNKIKSRTSTDLNHPDIIHALESNRNIIQHMKEEYARPKLREFMKVAKTFK
jgi:hypothetical protein